MCISIVQQQSRQSGHTLHASSAPEAGAATGVPASLLVRFLARVAGVAGDCTVAAAVDSRLCTALAVRGRAVRAVSAAALTDSAASCLPALSSTYMKHANVALTCHEAGLYTLQGQARQPYTLLCWLALAINKWQTAEKWFRNVLSLVETKNNLAPASWTASVDLKSTAPVGPAQRQLQTAAHTAPASAC